MRIKLALAIGTVMFTTDPEVVREACRMIWIITVPAERRQPISFVDPSAQGWWSTIEKWIANPRDAHLILESDEHLVLRSAIRELEAFLRRSEEALG